MISNANGVLQQEAGPALVFVLHVELPAPVCGVGISLWDL